MKKLLLIFLTALVTQAAVVRSNLLQFADLASKENKTQILISGSIIPDDFIFLQMLKTQRLA